MSEGCVIYYWRCPKCEQLVPGTRHQKEGEPNKIDLSAHFDTMHELACCGGAKTYLESEFEPVIRDRSFRSLIHFGVSIYCDRAKLYPELELKPAI